MKISRELLDWIERNAESVSYGQVGVVLYIRGGRLAWVEKSKTESEKADLKNRP